MLQQLEKEYLSDAYSYYQRSGERSMQYDFSSDITAKREVLRCLDALRDEGYIEYEYIATRFCGIKLTPKGIKFAENDYQELPTDNSPSIYGDNNIFVNGSGNTVSNNYNKISSDIESADIAPELKELLETLLYELKNPNLSEEKRSSKIKSFLSDVSSNTLSDAASSALTVLLASLFKSIQF